MKKILCACGNGMGSSIMIKIKVEDVLKKLNIEANVDTSSISEAKGCSNNYDVVLCSTYLVEDLQNTTAHVVGLDNLLDSNQIEKALKSVFCNE